MRSYTVFEYRVDTSAFQLREEEPPDTSLFDFFWINGTLGEGSLLSSNKGTSKHYQTNQESVNAWAGQRTFELFQLENLRYPENGLEYSD